MFARGNNRNNGANLGLGCVNANNALSYSNGNNWRGRLYLAKGWNLAIVERQKAGIASKPETPLKSAGAPETGPR